MADLRPLPDEPPRPDHPRAFPSHPAAAGRIGRSTFSLGATLAALGAIALFAPWAAATAIDMLCGVLLIAAGAGQLFLASRSFDWSGFWLSLVCGALSLVGGTAMLVIPRAGVGTIVVFVGLLLAFEAAAKFAVAWSFRDTFPVGWVVFDALLTSLLAGLLLTARGDDTGTLLGTLVGINLLSSGLTFMATGWRLRRGLSHLRVDPR